MFPIEIDLSMVRRQRETGMKGLGQVLKSFRDRPADFSVYDRNSGVDSYLNTLGPLEVPQQGSRAGLHVDLPATAEADINDREPKLGIGISPVMGKTTGS